MFLFFFCLLCSPGASRGRACDTRLSFFLLFVVAAVVVVVVLCCWVRFRSVHIAVNNIMPCLQCCLSILRAAVCRLSTIPQKYNASLVSGTTCTPSVLSSQPAGLKASAPANSSFVLVTDLMSSEEPADISLTGPSGKNLLHMEGRVQ